MSNNAVGGWLLASNRHRTSSAMRNSLWRRAKQNGRTDSSEAGVGAAARLSGKAGGNRRACQLVLPTGPLIDGSSAVSADELDVTQLPEASPRYAVPVTPPQWPRTTLTTGLAEGYGSVMPRPWPEVLLMYLETKHLSAAARAGWVSAEKQDRRGSTAATAADNTITRAPPCFPHSPLLSPAPREGGRERPAERERSCCRERGVVQPLGARRGHTKAPGGIRRVGQARLRTPRPHPPVPALRIIENDLSQ